MTHATVTTSEQLARATAISKNLTRRGWRRRLEPVDAHPGAVAATTHARRGIRLLTLTLGERHGQIIEITAKATAGKRAQHARKVRDGKPSWRMTAYNPPTDAVLAAATAAFDGPGDPRQLQNAGWTIEHALVGDVGPQCLGMVRSTWFTRPDGAVTASFHVPAYNPPGEDCDYYGELGDAGGWFIGGPGFAADATAHTPTAVVGAFALALPGSAPQEPATTPTAPADTPQHSTKSTPAAATPPRVRVTAVVR